MCALLLYNSPSQSIFAGVSLQHFLSDFIFFSILHVVLQHVSEYDDSEALSIWAHSLFLTGDFDLAFKKNELALKYCQVSFIKIYF